MRSSVRMLITTSLILRPHCDPRSVRPSGSVSLQYVNECQRYQLALSLSLSLSMHRSCYMSSVQSPPPLRVVDRLLLRRPISDLYLAWRLARVRATYRGARVFDARGDQRARLSASVSNCRLQHPPLLALQNLTSTFECIGVKIRFGLKRLCVRWSSRS